MLKLFRSFSRVTIHWVSPDQSSKLTYAEVGTTLLKVAHSNEIELEGACEGSCACSTCHIILEDSTYEALPEPSADEDDMLDLAFGLTPTSRLGCQITVTAELEGATLTLPAASVNMYVDGHKPKPH